MEKVTLVLLADTSSKENLGRMLHVLLYAQQLLNEGLDVEIIFDGGGSEWPKELSDESHDLHDKYRKMLEDGVIKGVCSFCAEAFDVKEYLKNSDISLLDEHEGHPNIGRRVAKEGRHVMTF
jgi:hypothetical protein